MSLPICFNEPLGTHNSRIFVSCRFTFVLLPRTYRNVAASLRGARVHRIVGQGFGNRGPV